MLVDAAPGKFAVFENMAVAGSPVTTPKETDGTSAEFLPQYVYWVNDPPIVMLCRPLSQLTVSSTSRLDALRDCGEGAALALVRAVPIVPSVSWNPPWSASGPFHIDGVSSL